MGTVSMNMDQWSTAGESVQGKSQTGTDANNDVNLAIQALNNVLNTMGFVDNAKNLVTIMEEFGENMEAALACISVDLTVVGSGVKAAATAFTNLESQLASTFQQIDQQYAYFTNTASSITVPSPTDAQVNTLVTLLNEGNPEGSSASGFTWLLPDPSMVGEGVGLGALGGVAVWGLLVAA